MRNQTPESCSGSIQLLGYALSLFQNFDEFMLIE